MEGVDSWEGDWFKDQDFIEYCDKIKNNIHNWVKDIPQDILKKSEFTENQKEFIKLFRLLTPPHLTDISDKMIEIIIESGEDCKAELDNLGKDVIEFPAITTLWRTLQAKITSFEKGIRKGVEREIYGILAIDGEEKQEVTKISDQIKAIEGFDENKKLESIVEDLENADETSNPIDIIVSGLSGQLKVSLPTRILGVLQVFSKQLAQEDKRKMRLY